jgi:hypothetical protein
MDRHHMRLVELRRRVGFTAEPLLKHAVLSEVRRQHLQHHDAIGHGVIGPPHLAHAATAQQLDQPVLPERRPVHISLPGNCGSAATISP